MYCIYCGRINPDDGVFCSYCGRKLHDEMLSEELVDADAGFASSKTEYTKPEVINLQEDAGPDAANLVNASDLGDESIHEKATDHMDISGYEKASDHMDESNHKKASDSGDISGYEKASDCMDESNHEKATDREKNPGKPAGKSKGRRSDKRIWIIAATVIALAAAVILYLPKEREHNVNKDAVYTLRTDAALTIMSNPHKYETVIYDSAGRKLHTIKYNLAPYYCRDRSSAVLMNSVRLKYTHYVNADEVKELRRDANLAKITEDGRYIYYIVNDDSGSILYSCDTGNMTEKKLSASVDKIMVYLVVSPDGETVAYATRPILSNEYIDYDDSKVESFILRKGLEPEALPAGHTVIAISDDTEYIYYVAAFPNSEELHLYVDSSGKSILLNKNMSNTFLSFNEDYSEVIISGSNSTHISVNGGEPMLLADSPAVLAVMPQDCATSNDKVFCHKVYGISTFSKAVLLCRDYTLKLIDEDYWVEDIGELAPYEMLFSEQDNRNILSGKAVMSSDGNEIIYISRDNKLIKASGIIKGETSHMVLTGFADDFAVSNDLVHVYYTWKNELFYINSEGDSIFIDDYMTGLNSSTDGSAVFYRINAQYGKGPLYYSIAGSPAIRVEDIVEVNEALDSDGVLVFKTIAPIKEQYYYNPKGIIINKLYDSNR